MASGIVTKTLRIQTSYKVLSQKFPVDLNSYAHVGGAQGVSSNEWSVVSAIYWRSRPELINKIKEASNTCLYVGDCK
jgi:hypothetical protein